MFYFEQILQTALNGLDASNMTGVINVAQWVLIAAVIAAVFKAWRDWDPAQLGVTLIRLLVIGLIFANYGTVFRDVNGMFTSVAHYIDNTTAGGVDVFSKWTTDLGAYWSQQGMPSLFGLIIGALAGLVESLLLLIGYLAYPVAAAIFALLYILYGSILYATGPLVLGLFPAPPLYPIARTYVINLMIFNAWSIVYSIFGALMAAIGMNSVSNVLASGNFLGMFTGVSNSLLLGLASVLFSVCLMLIPVLSYMIVKGDVGQSVMLIARTTYAAGKGIASLFKHNGG